MNDTVVNSNGQLFSETDDNDSVLTLRQDGDTAKECLNKKYLYSSQSGDHSGASATPPTSGFPNGVNRSPSVRFKRSSSNIDSTSSPLSTQHRQQQFSQRSTSNDSYNRILFSRRSKSFGGIAATAPLVQNSSFSINSRSLMLKNSDEENDSTMHPIVKNSNTFESSDDSEDVIDFDYQNSNYEAENSCGSSFIISSDILKSPKQRPIQVECDNDDHEFRLRRLISELGTATMRHEDDHIIEWNVVVPNVYYISLFGILGTVLRIYMGRFFGLDCEQKDSDNAMTDWFSKVSERICVTASGKTKQTGGALFIDLPANMLGSFIMGFITPTILPNQPFPYNEAVHMGLKFGLCGCLTTFASWNTQMVVMLDGTGTELGSQIGPAIFGYVIGITCSLSSFAYGRQIVDWQRRELTRQTTSTDLESSACKLGTDEKLLCRQSPESSLFVFVSQIMPLCLSVGLLSLFIVGDVVKGEEFYRKMWMSIMFTPIGAVGRWILAKLNAKGLSFGNLHWFPLGTFIANVLGAVVCIVALATLSNLSDRGAVDLVWTAPLLEAIGSGFAGSLSTVSTLVKELATTSNPIRAHGYFLSTLLLSMIVGLILYRPIVTAT